MLIVESMPANQKLLSFVTGLAGQNGMQMLKMMLLIDLVKQISLIKHAAKDLLQKQELYQFLPQLLAQFGANGGVGQPVLGRFKSELPNV